MTHETDTAHQENPENETSCQPMLQPKSCLGVKAISQYKKMGVEITPEDYARLKADLENNIIYQDFENIESDQLFVKQSMLMDIAFHYFYAGGEAGIINDDAFLLALRAQRQCRATIEFVRQFRHNKKKFEFQQEKFEYEIQRR